MSETKLTGAELQRMADALPADFAWNDGLDPYALREILSAMGYFELLDALRVLTIKRHMFSPTEFGGYVCRHCDGLPHDAQHFRAGEDAKTDIEKAKAVLAKATEPPMTDREPDYLDLDTDRYGWCKTCAKEVVLIKRDVGIGRYEYHGSKGIHIDLRDHCADCENEI